MSKRISVTFTDEQMEIIEKIAKREGTSLADTVRNLCDKSLNLEITEDNIDFISDIIDERLNAILKPQIERLASLIAKGGIMSATSSFLNLQALSTFTKASNEKIVDIYNTAKIKGIAYMRTKTTDSEKMIVKESNE